MPRSVDPDRSHKTHSNSGRLAAAADEVAAAAVVGTFARSGMEIRSVAAEAAETVDGACRASRWVAGRDAAVAACAVATDDADAVDRPSNGIGEWAGKDVVAAWDVACRWWWALVDCWDH